MKLPAALLFFSPFALLLAGCLATTTPAKKPPAPKLDVPEGEVLLGSGAPPPASAAPEVLIGAPPAAAATDPAPAVIPTGPEELLPTVTPEGVVPTAAARPPGGFPIIRRGASGAYVLLKSPGGVPAGTTMIVVRGGKPVGTIRVSAPRQPGYLSADIVEGDIQPGDFARP